jgi:hypothetical protein
MPELHVLRLPDEYPGFTFYVFTFYESGYEHFILNTP